MARISGDAFVRVVPDLAVNNLTLVDGPLGSGKTAELVRHAAQAVNEGRDVLVVCTTRVAADDFACRVDKRGGRRAAPMRYALGAGPRDIGEGGRQACAAAP